jgi:Holliday junction DNA helicase RuvA
MIVELSSLIDSSFVESEETMPDVRRSVGEEAIVALASLGFDESQARRTVVKILRNSPDVDMHELIKGALKEMRK